MKSIFRSFFPNKTHWQVHKNNLWVLDTTLNHVWFFWWNQKFPGDPPEQILMGLPFFHLHIDHWIHEVRQLAYKMADLLGNCSKSKDLQNRLCMTPHFPFHFPHKNGVRHNSYWGKSTLVSIKPKITARVHPKNLHDCKQSFTIFNFKLEW